MVILLVLMALAAIFVVFSRDLLYAVISLGFLSVFTSILFYSLGSPYASMLELSIGAGLITILFMATISLVEQPKPKQGKIFGLTYLNVFALTVIAVIALWIGLSLVKGGVPSLVAPVSPGTLPEILWGDRLLDVFGLGIIIFTAAIGMGVLFRTEGGK
ncbi:MAG TPA: DUF4040 domain-containing protein [Firmicutes bacterium]|nr:DUF4040 domain-containing protein [Bacillota bacterium]